MGTLPLDMRNHDSLIGLADSYARDNQLLCNDVCRMILPEASRIPSESLLSGVTRKLLQIVSEIERELTGEKQETPTSWPWLSRSGLLREAGLVNFLMACEAEEMIEDRISRGADTALGGQIAARLIGDEHDGIAEAAQSILAHASLRRRKAAMSIHDMPPEMLHQLCWRIVAALQMEQGAENKHIRDNAHTLLGSFDESRSARGAARKLLHFTRARGEDGLEDIGYAGCGLFIALLAQESGLTEDFILNLVHGASASVLAVIQRSAGISAENAMRNLAIFSGFEMTPIDITLFDSDYEQITDETVQSVIASWGEQNERYLSGISEQANA